MANEKSILKKIARLRRGVWEEVDDLVVVEKPVTLFLNGSELVTLLCTPEKLDCLAIGFLRSEGLLLSMDEINSLQVNEKDGFVEVDLKNKTGFAEKLYGKRTITSGCGKGTVFFSVLDSLRSNPLEGTMEIDAVKILSLVSALQKKATLFETTGGVHSAALADQEEIILFFEDIGRHNAIDKIIGAAMQSVLETDDKIMVSSGRLSSEILLKAAKMKIQLLISRAAPTSLCLELAENLNITLVGFARGERINVYTHRWRITGAL
jgi:FdhD protein